MDIFLAKITEPFEGETILGGFFTIETAFTCIKNKLKKDYSFENMPQKPPEPSKYLLKEYNIIYIDGFVKVKEYHISFEIVQIEVDFDPYGGQNENTDWF